MRITIFDYGAGNIHSLTKALSGSGTDVVVEPDPMRAIETDVLVLSGVGALRYGVYASKLGVGFDWGAPLGTRFRLDAYDPNSFKLDARALLKVNNDFSLWLGADSLFKRTTPVIGVRLTR